MSKSNQQYSTGGGRVYPDAMDGTVGGDMDAGNNEAAFLDAAGLAERIQEAHARISGWEDQRQALGDKITLEVAMLEKYGIKKAAFKDARKYLMATTKDRAGLDMSYRLCRTALGVPIQDELPLDVPARH